MKLTVISYCRLILAALLVGAASTAFAWAPCGANLQYEIVGSELRLMSPDPEQPATIYAQAFKDRTDITDIVFPDNLTEISSAAFYGCTGITDIVLPPALTSIGLEAFYGCSSLAYVLCRPFTAPTLLNDGFTSCATGLEICVPNFGSYNNTDFWNNYTLTSCSFLDEYDEQTIAEGKISAFRGASRTDIDIFRTLRKAGCFNTLTLPFSVSLSGSPLDGDNVEVYEFAGATVLDGALQLDITPLVGNTLVAGRPYLIQWDNTGEVLNRMQFSGITWDNDQTAGDAGTGDVTYHGFYGKTHISDDTQGEQHLNLFLGGGNELFWPNDGDDESAKMLGFRAWFRINGSSVSGAPIRRGMPATLRIVATPTAIDEISSSLQGGDRGRLILRDGQLVIIRNGQTFSLNGQRL